MLLTYGTYVKITRRDLFDDGICLYGLYGIILKNVETVSADSKYGCYKIGFINGHRASAYENEFKVVSHAEFKIAQVMDS
jgi:hypothetical protein